MGHARRLSPSLASQVISTVEPRKNSRDPLGAERVEVDGDGAIESV